MSEMNNQESFERIDQGFLRAASCCRELAVMTKINAWVDLAKQFLVMRNKAKAMYEGVPLTEIQVHALVMEMEIAQKMSAAMRANV